MLPDVRSRTGAPDLWWSRVGIVAVGLVLAVALVGAAWALGRPVGLLLTGLVLASAMAGPMGKLERWLPRPAAVLVAHGLLVCAVGALSWFIAARLLTGANGLLAIFPTALERARAMVTRWDPALGQQAERTVQAALTGLAGDMAEAPLALVVTATEVVLVLVMSVYWLLAAEELLGFLLSLLPSRRRPEAEAVLREVAGTMGGFVRANVLDALVVGALVYGGLLLIGVDFSLALALLAAVCELIPLVGLYLAAPAVLAVAVMAGPVQAVAALVLLVAVKQLEAHVVLPRLTAREAAIPPLLAVFALLAGGTAGGLLGAVVAVPLAGALRVLVVRVVAPAVRRRTGAAASGPEPVHDPAEPAAA
jgi:predicted PurR-regulated permease PerM